MAPVVIIDTEPQLLGLSETEESLVAVQSQKKVQDHTDLICGLAPLRAAMNTISRALEPA